MLTPTMFSRRRTSPQFSAKLPRQLPRTTVGFHNFNLRIFNLRVKSEQIKCGCFFDAMSDFNVPGSRPNKNTMKFRKSTELSQSRLARLPQGGRKAVARRIGQPSSYGTAENDKQMSGSHSRPTMYISLYYIYIYIYICTIRELRIWMSEALTHSSSHLSGGRFLSNESDSPNI